jgi:hypothetical protein
MDPRCCLAIRCLQRLFSVVEADGVKGFTGIVEHADLVLAESLPRLETITHNAARLRTGDVFRLHLRRPTYKDTTARIDSLAVE